MRPTLRQMQYLIAIAERGTFRSAASAMNVSQPSLSNQIQDMEQVLDTRLVERGRNGALLTPAGVEVVRSAREILNSVERMKDTAWQNSGPLAGRIRLGVIPSIGPYLLPHVTGKLHSMYPDLRINIQDQRTSVLDRMLDEGRVDVLLSTREDHANTHSTRLFVEDLWICVAPDSPLAASRGPLRLEELEGQQLLSIGPGNQINLAIQNLAKLSGAFVSSEYEGNGLDATRIMAAMGAGIAVLPSLYALQEARRDQNLCVRKIQDVRTSREISLVWRSTSPMASDFEALAAVIKEVAETLLVE
ncbi:MAG: LysR substrate-binding domain-containing protein [Pseudomonadota bacterium]